MVKHLEAPGGYTLTNFEATQIEGTGFDDKAAFKGVITFGADMLYSRSLMYRDLIASVVNDQENFENVCWGIKLIDDADPDYQSATVRDFSIDKLCQLLNAGDITIIKSKEGIPVVMKGNEVLSIPVSLSHHEEWVGYSFKLKDL